MNSPSAHAEALTPTGRFARHYIHTGMIALDGEKMSKSLGNLVLVSKLLAAGVDAGAIRLGLLAGHYRQDRAWTDDVLRTAQDRIALWRKAVALDAAQPADDTVARVRQHLADDLDSPKALDALDAWSRHALSTGGTDKAAPALISDTVDSLLGVSL